ncbi:hypothetical protein [Aquimarina pacifica]|uniref:hypothetical protein n=1 Tax=Aquimarina pacifica TaxID=1296415 RepID=UPI00046E6E3B|nr:hypothetical protein [Aquimarina pacifica]
MNVIKYIEFIERIDQLVRLKATGTPTELASKLGVSKGKLYRIINTMKALDAPISYNNTIQCYVYDEAVDFRFGFFDKKELNKKQSP